MGLITEEVIIKLYSKRVKYYKEKGYKLPIKENGKYDLNSEFVVKVKDLPKNSHEMIDCTCDYCGKLLRMRYQDYNNQLDNSLSKICCVQCKYNKAQITNLEKYKKKNPMQNSEVKHRQEQTCIKNFGYPSYFQTDEFKNNITKWNKEKLGVEWATQSLSVREKIKISLMKHYDCEYPSQSLCIQNKIRKSLYDNNTAPTSKQQKYLCYLYKGCLNYPINNFSGDIVLSNEKIDIEYSGGGHWNNIIFGAETEESFKQKEIKRFYVIKQEGYKQIEIISRKDWLPSDEILLRMLEDAKQYFKDYPNHSWFEFDIDNQIIRNAENKDGVPYFYGELRKITKEDLKSA